MNIKGRVHMNLAHTLRNPRGVLALLPLGGASFFL
jgi:hypothetical protein